MVEAETNPMGFRKLPDQRSADDGPVELLRESREGNQNSEKDAARQRAETPAAARWSRGVEVLSLPLYQKVNELPVTVSLALLNRKQNSVECVESFPCRPCLNLSGMNSEQCSPNANHSSQPLTIAIASIAIEIDIDIFNRNLHERT
jgi:hypothetical protein